jgi:DMSO/TMAO reductase YedYZ molybdopterin-dependent catalytic subunit
LLGTGRMRWQVLLMAFAVLAGCAPSAPTATPLPPEIPVALKLTGKVGKEMAWSKEQVRAMPAMEVQAQNKQGERSIYAGVSISVLLEMASVQAEASTVVFTAGDGSSAEAQWAEVQACQDCIISFRNKGGFSVVMPDFPGDLQVKGVVEIHVK